jgi:DNA repair exonuclease SbcCD ATPase subunit
MPEQSAVRDPRSLFDIDERLVELMDQVADAAADGQEPRTELIEEINEYIEAFQSKVDRIAGYLRWQEAIASICSSEAERLSARKKAAEGRVSRLKNMLLHFMLSRGLKSSKESARQSDFSRTRRPRWSWTIRSRSASASSSDPSASRRPKCRN